MKKIYPLLILAMLANSVSSFAQIVYVTVNGAGLQDGTSWANAYNGQQLSTIVSSWPNNPVEVWVAAGTYYPHPTSRDSSFRVTSNVQVFGGFNGTETMLSQRDWNTNVTTLSGDIGIANDVTDNSFNVVRFENVSLCGIDGFTIENGNANDVVNPWKSYGGAIFNMSAGTSFSLSDPGVWNCKIVNNISAESGGAIANVSLTGQAIMTLINCHIANNTAARYGGAIYSVGWPTTSQFSPPGNSHLIAYNCDFIANTVTSPSSNSAGGAVCISGGGGNNGGGFTRCNFTDNFSSTTGGAFTYSSFAQYSPNTGTSNISFDSCSFTHNGIPENAGMAISSVASEDLKTNMTVKNTTFENNYSTAAFGATVTWFTNNGSSSTVNKFIGCKFLNNYRGSQGNTILSNSNPNNSGTVEGNDSLWVSNSFFYNNTMGDDIWLNGTNNTKHVTIVSNTTIYHDSTTTGSAASIHNNATNYNSMIYPNTESAVYVYNSILWHKVPYWGNTWQFEVMNENVGTFISPMAAHSYVSNSILFGSTSWPAAYGVNGGGNNGNYPGFTDTAGMDFHLLCNAYGVDHGNNAQMLPATFTTDVDGHGRVFNNTVDIGAFETHVQQLVVVPIVTLNGMTISYNNNLAGLTDSVHWDFGDGDTSNTDNGTHTYTQTGTFTICLYAENGCGSDDTCFDITLTTGVAGLSKKENYVILYPNPVDDVLHVDDVENAADIIIYNSVGQQVSQEYIQAGKTLTINVSRLPAGAYILETNNKHGKALHGRFVKQ